MDERIDIPAIGAAKGLFEILVPGVFLLLNVMWILYYFQGSIWKDTSIFKLISDNTILMLVVIIVMGYLTGVVIWLLGSNTPDRLSGWFRNHLHSGDEPYYSESFPYIESLGSIVGKSLPALSKKFYLNCWAPRKSMRKINIFLIIVRPL